MIRSTRRTATLAGLGLTGAAGLLAAGLALPGIAQAEPTPSPSTSASATPAKPDREAQRAQRQQEMAAALAKELGIDEAKVAAALEKVQTQRQEQARTQRTERLKTELDAAVAAGKLTRAEADAILKAAQNGVLPGGGGHRGGFGGGMRPGR